MFFYLIMFFLLTFMAVTASALMDTIHHHGDYKTVFWRRFGWHKATGGFKKFLYKFIKGDYRSSLPILKASNDAWHWAKRVLLVSLVLIGVFLALMVEEAQTSDATDYIFLILLVFNVVWCFLFWKIYDKWMIHRKFIDGRWYEYAFANNGKYYFPVGGSEKDPYA